VNMTMMINVFYMTMVAFLVRGTNAQFGGEGPSGKVIKEDLEYIRCEACEYAVNELFAAVREARSTAPNKKLSEVHIVELIEAISNPTNITGEWLRSVDMVETPEKGKVFLTLEQPGGKSKCKNECTTLAESVHSLFQEEIDADDLSAILWKNKATVEELQTKVCEKWTSRCRKPRRKPLASRYKRVDEEFAQQDEKELEMERMMAEMRGMGMGGSMYSREDMMAQMAAGGMMDGYGDDGYGGGYGGMMDPYGGMMGGMGGGMDPYGGMMGGMGSDPYGDEDAGEDEGRTEGDMDI